MESTFHLVGGLPREKNKVHHPGDGWGGCKKKPNRSEHKNQAKKVADLVLKTMLGENKPLWAPRQTVSQNKT